MPGKLICRLTHGLMYKRLYIVAPILLSAFGIFALCGIGSIPAVMFKVEKACRHGNLLMQIRSKAEQDASALGREPSAAEKAQPAGQHFWTCQRKQICLSQ